MIKKDAHNKHIVDDSSLNVLSSFAERCFMKFQKKISSVIVKKNSHETQGLVLLFRESS
jgi:hypothetical protein